MTTTHRLSLRIPEPLYQQALHEAQRLGVSLNALLLVALDAYLQRGAPQSAPRHRDTHTTTPSPPSPHQTTSNPKHHKKRNRPRR